jgi:hypothetical protein
MAKSRMAGGFEIQSCPMIGPYNLQRFVQFGPEDNANWYLAKGENSKEPYAMFPVMGRSHINYIGLNRLVFGSEPRRLFKTIDYFYVIDGNTIWQYDSNYNPVNISGNVFKTLSGPVYFTFLVVNNIVFACFVDTQFVYIYQEGTASLQLITDPNAPGGIGSGTKPGYIAAFGNRITVSVADSAQFILSAINLVGNGASPAPGYAFDPAKCFTNFVTPQVFAQEDGIIRQMGVLNNTLYIFTDYVTGVWSNIVAMFSGSGTLFPWKKNSSYNWNFGIANPESLDIDFGLIVFLARNSDGLLQFMKSTGGQPESITTKAISTLLQKYSNALGSQNPFLVSNSNGFLYQYENTIFYRIAGGNYLNAGILDQVQNANCIEYSFEAEEWHRCIELNGERNRIQNHVYFNFKHLVTVTDDGTIYEMSGQFYYNEITNPDQDDPQAADAYLAYPFRYERVTPIIYEKDYAEFETEYVQIDFVFGQSNIVYSTAPFANAQFLIAEKLLAGQPQFIIAEKSDADGQPIFILGEVGNTPGVNELIYNTLFKPSIELFWSDNSGISFHSADIREFSQQGQYQWRMRWYQLGPSRNRVYKLVCVSPVPIVILGSVMNVKRISGGAN